MILNFRKVEFIIEENKVDFTAVVFGFCVRARIEFTSEKFIVSKNYTDRNNVKTLHELTDEQREMYQKAINAIKYRVMYAGESYSYDGLLLNKGTGDTPIVIQDPDETLFIGDKHNYEYTAYDTRGLVHQGRFEVINSNDFKVGDYFLTHHYCKYTHVRVAQKVTDKRLAYTLNNVPINDLSVSGGGSYKSNLKLISTYDQIVRQVDYPDKK